MNTQFPVPAQLQVLTTVAQAAGAEGIWFIRGTREAELAVTFEEADPSGDETIPVIHLAPPHDLIVLLRFPVGDGGEAGIEAR